MEKIKTEAIVLVRKGNAFKAFDILVPTDKGSKWMNADLFIETCAKFELPMVPTIATIPFDFDKVMALVEGNTTIPNISHIREGIVVKPLIDRWDERLGRVCLKFINPKYLEKN